MLLLAALQFALPSSAGLPDVAMKRPRPIPDLDRPIAPQRSVTLDHPIFAPDRAPVILAAQSFGNLAGYEVIGTAIAGNTSTALVRDATGRIIRIQPDGTLQGWRLVSIERTQLVFDRDGERRTLAVDVTPAHSPVGMGLLPSVRPGSQNAAGNSGDSDDDSSDDSDSDDNN